MPKARSEGLLRREVADDLVVYDTRAHRALCLNRAVTTIWQRCDGTTPRSEVAGHLDLDEAADGVLELGLAELGHFGLLDQDEARPSSPEEPSRRELIQHLVGRGLALATLPGIFAITAPVAAQTTSFITAKDCRKQVFGMCGGTTCIPVDPNLPPSRHCRETIFMGMAECRCI